MPTHPRPVVRVAALALTFLALVGCASANLGSADPSDIPPATVAASPDPTAPAAAPTDEAPEEPGTFVLPASCEGLYSASMLANLSSQNPPLNDPGVSLRSTALVAGLELLDSGMSTISCTWGAAGAAGLSTTVAAVTAADAASMLDALQASGFMCEPFSEGTLCAFSEQTVNRDDEVVRLGESHYLRGGGWVATSWVNFFPAGYTQDIAATLWR